MRTHAPGFRWRPALNKGFTLWVLRSLFESVPFSADLEKKNRKILRLVRGKTKPSFVFDWKLFRVYPSRKELFSGCFFFFHSTLRWRSRLFFFFYFDPTSEKLRGNFLTCSNKRYSLKPIAIVAVSYIASKINKEILRHFLEEKLLYMFIYSFIYIYINW